VNTAEAGLAIDADGSTVWQSKQAQAPGQWLQVDLGSARHFREVALDSGGQLGDFAATWQVATSNDGVHWSKPVTGSSTGQLTTVELRPTKARYLRVTSTATSANWWSLADLRLYR
jgi:glucosylceramidase